MRKKNMGDVDLFSVLFFEGSKKRWYGAGNRPNPEYLRWKDDPEYGGPEPASRIRSDVRTSRGFELGVFSGLGTQGGRLEYLRGTSMFLGSGSSRVVFAVSPKQVIKLAGGNRLDLGGVDNPSSRMVEAGIYQNRREHGLWEELGGEGVGRLLPRIFDISEDGTWLLAELVRPLGGIDELRELIGLDGDDFARLMRVLGEHGHMNSEYFKNFVLGVREKVDGDESLGDDEREGARRGLEFVLLLHGLKERDSGLSLAELTDSSAWGKGSDGRLVLLDPGADETLMKRYYNG